MRKKKRSRFITFEGGEGCGKSTQVALLADVLRSQGVSVCTTREPGGSSGAEEIRSLLVCGETNRWDAVSETLLLYAARREHLCRTILPALENGQWVVCDRFVDSSLTYQGAGKGIDRSFLDALYKAVAGDIKPDITFILDIPAEKGLSRAKQRGGGEDRYEKMDMSFHERIRKSFLDIAEKEPSRCVVIDACGTQAEVHTRILTALYRQTGDFFQDDTNVHVFL